MLFDVVKSLNVKKRDVSIFSDNKQKFWIFYQLSDFLPQPWETSTNYVMHFTIFSCLVDLVVSITVLLLLLLVLEPLPLLSELRPISTTQWGWKQSKIGCAMYKLTLKYWVRKM